MYMRKVWQMLLLPHVVMFGAVMVVVFVMYFMAQANVTSQVQDTVAMNTKRTEEAVQDRLDLFEETLRAGVGLFAGKSDISQQDWSQFVNASAVLKRYPGAQGLGYVRVVKKNDIASFVSSRKKTKADYAVFPSGDRETYAPVVYFQSSTDAPSTALGFDMYTEQKRFAAMTSARDAGEVYITDTLHLLANSEPVGDSGFVMYAPQYAQDMPIDTTENRQAAIQGYVYAVFRVDTFMKNIMVRDRNSSITYAVYPKNDSTALYKEDGYEQAISKPHEELSDDVVIDGSPFRFNFVYEKNAVLARTAIEKPMVILSLGTVAAIMIAGATWLLLKGRANEMLLVQERSINDAKDSLLSIASHQLRTPATGVKQYLGLVLQGFAGSISPQQESLLEKAYESNERQLRTINDVLYLARLDSGRIVLTKTKLELNSLIQSLVEEQESKIKESQHTVKLDLPKRNVYAVADGHMLGMAVENLLTNAIKYTHKKGKITIKMRRKGDEAVISVTDTGVGISAENIDRLFKEFSRIPNDLSRTVSGTGIGLYLSRNLILLHGGDITVTSTEGVGSTFSIHIPISA